MGLPPLTIKWPYTQSLDAAAARVIVKSCG
jgi:hypothetical protein